MITAICFCVLPQLHVYSLIHVIDNLMAVEQML